MCKSEGDFRLSFLLGQVATGVAAIPVAIGKCRTGAEPTATEGKVLASGAGTAQEFLALQRVFGTTELL